MCRTHLYFHGMVELCVDRDDEWGGGSGDWNSSGLKRLMDMMKNFELIKGTEKLEFPAFALEWLHGKDKHAAALKVGMYNQSNDHYLEQDLSQRPKERWIHELRSERSEGVFTAANTLLEVATMHSDDSFATKKTMLSLSALANLAAAPPTSPGMVPGKRTDFKDRENKIVAELALMRVQEKLRSMAEAEPVRDGMDEDGNSHSPVLTYGCMKPDEMVDYCIRKIQGSHSQLPRVREVQLLMKCSLYALSIADTVDFGDIRDANGVAHNGVELASEVWKVVAEKDQELWERLANPQGGVGTPGDPEKEMADTLLYQVVLLDHAERLLGSYKTVTHRLVTGDGGGFGGGGDEGGVALASLWPGENERFRSHLAKCVTAAMAEAEAQEQSRKEQKKAQEEQASTMAGC